MCTVINNMHIYRHLAWCCWQCFAQSLDWNSPIILWSLTIRWLWCSSVQLYVGEVSSFPVPFVVVVVIIANSILQLTVACQCQLKDTVSNIYNFSTAIQSFSLQEISSTFPPSLAGWWLIQTRRIRHSRRRWGQWILWWVVLWFILDMVWYSLVIHIIKWDCW